MIQLEGYKDKKVLLTGHTGFKGGWLLAILHHLGAEVRGYALEPNSHKGIYSQINGDSLCESVIADIRDRNRIEKEIIEFQPDYIFHLAAQPLVRASYDNPSYTFEVNVMGTSYVLESLLKLEKKCVCIVITTDKVYENKENGKSYVENDRLGGHDPYSTSKACAELVVGSFISSYFSRDKVDFHQKKIATVRAGNVIGGGDFSRDRIIPDLINAMEGNETLKVRNPNSIRPWQHVLEPLVGYLQLGQVMASDSGVWSSAYNFGPEEHDHLPVIDLVKESISIWGSGDWEILKQDNLHEAGILKLDISLAKKDLGWKPQFTSRQAIQYTVEWYRSQNKHELTYAQIKNYLDLLR